MQIRLAKFRPSVARVREDPSGEYKLISTVGNTFPRLHYAIGSPIGLSCLHRRRFCFSFSFVRRFCSESTRFRLLLGFPGHTLRRVRSHRLFYRNPLPFLHTFTSSPVIAAVLIRAPRTSTSPRAFFAVRRSFTSSSSAFWDAESAIR
ncbi:hypothetical protein L596_008277 [Steinernema carpocapsae]|uniref:Uncharacterized protein n=1 Tax=Steinernema carpocapsae TaxID=34508 RepID=A0A4U5PBZ4_STECR|nr:hypothetical protein L596_008277 [Steinernema carpocapsae]